MKFLLEAWLRRHWSRAAGGRVYHQTNVAGSEERWRKNYRVPDLVLLTPDRFDIDRNEYFCGAPAVVVEIHSPGDEAYKKLPFHFQLGVLETWICSRDGLQPEIFARGKTGFVSHVADADGWRRSPALRVEFLWTAPNKLVARLEGDAASREEITPVPAV